MIKENTFCLARLQCSISSSPLQGLAHRPSPVLLDIGDNTLEDLTAAGEEAPPYIVGCFFIFLFVYIFVYEYILYCEYKLSGITLTAFYTASIGKYYLLTYSMVQSPS